ncbi:MAG: sulfotransferase family protein [Solirubrobacterales bacterium]
MDTDGTSPAGDGVESRLADVEQALTAQAKQIERTLKQLDAAEARDTGPRALRRAPDGPAAATLARPLSVLRENVMPVDQPLALICQAQRSGGTLLGRLFDGHPQCHAHPHELHIGDRRPHIWPSLPLDSEPEVWFANLEEERLGQMFEKGRRRIPLKAPGERPEESYYPFLLPPAFQRLIFLQEVERRAPITSERQILDSYMTSLFNGWLDNQNLRGAEKRWVVAFSPRRAWGDGLDKLFELYPDGRLISILRDPESWFSSAQGRDPEADPEALLELWKRSADEMTEAKERYGELVFVLRFEELVRDTEATMRSLAGFLGIDYDPILATPTFNGYPVGANSSFEVHSTGVLSDPVDRYKEVLSEEQRRWILGECGQLYEKAQTLVDRPATVKRRSSAKKSPARASKGSKPQTAKKRSASRKR